MCLSRAGDRCMYYGMYTSHTPLTHLPMSQSAFVSNKHSTKHFQLSVPIQLMFIPATPFEYFLFLKSDTSSYEGVSIPLFPLGKPSPHTVISLE